MTEFAFVLGNGQTRLEFDTKQLQPLGTVYACNRMFNDKHVDVLVSVDKGMTEEVQRHKLFSYYKEHYTRPEHTNNMSLPLDKRWQGYSSGPNAVGIAVTKGHAYIFLIGMDLTSKTDFINNIYAGTDHYAAKQDTPTFYGNWVNQIVHIAETYPNIRLIHVNPVDNFTPDDWKSMPNFSVMSKSEFITFVGMDK